MDGLRARLSPVENDVLTLRLMEVSWKEVKDILGQGVRKMERMRRSIAENAQVIWNDGVPERVGTVGVDNGDGGG